MYLIVHRGINNFLLISKNNLDIKISIFPLVILTLKELIDYAQIPNILLLNNLL